MADQTVRIQNMPESGSPARVALDMAHHIRTHVRLPADDYRKAFLDLYDECLKAATNCR